MTIKQYAEALEKLVVKAVDEKELKEHLGAFLEFVAENNDTHLLKKVFETFEKQYCKKENIVKAYIEFGEKSGENADFIKSLKKLFQERQKNLMVSSKTNPNLINGVRINYNDNYLIEASFSRVLNQMFKHG